MRRTTSVIHNSKKEMHQSVEAINMALKELLPQDSFIVGTGKDNPEMQLVQVGRYLLGLIVMFHSFHSLVQKSVEAHFLFFFSSCELSIRNSKTIVE